MESPITAEARDWSSLLPEIMDLIVKRIDRYGDFFVFASVCKSWHLASCYAQPPESAPDFPLLMLSDGTKMEEDTYVEELKHTVETRSFFNIFSSTQFDVNLPEAYGKKCFALNFGWLLTIGIDQNMQLLHPFSRRQISLPNFRTFIHHSADPFSDDEFQYMFKCFIRRAIVSCSPNDESNCIIFIIFTDVRLAFARIGDTVWTYIKTPLVVHNDIIYYKGLLYVIECKGLLYQCDISSESPKVVGVAPRPPERHTSNCQYLVEANGDLLLVIQYFEYLLLSPESPNDVFDNELLRYHTSDFKIFKLEIEGPQHRWNEINNLGDLALFLGDNSSVSIRCDHNNPIMGNCIYFTDYNTESFPSAGGGYDMGIFDLQDKSIRRHYSGPSRSTHCAPLWIIVPNVVFGYSKFHSAFPSATPTSVERRCN